MALANGVRFIWLDAHIGKENEYEDFKKKFRNTLEEAGAIPPDAINVLIWTLEQNAGPVLFAHTRDGAIALIETHHDKRIIFISSGAFGEKIIPEMSPKYSHVNRYYFFCGNIAHYVEFGLAYDSCLQMFDFETDLLVRLTRDISGDIIKQGEIYLQIDDGINALKCFEHSLTLNIKANEIDQFNGQCMIYIRQLNGDGNNIGLIQKTKDMLNQEQQQQPTEEEADDEEEKMSQQESHYQ